MARRLKVISRRLMRRNMFAQMLFIGIFWLIGEALARITSAPIPGSIIGLFLVILLLAFGKVSVFSMKRGAETMLAEMLLFFVPAVLALLDHKEFFGILGLKILIVIVGGTLVVMAITALTIDFCCLWIERHGKH